jgi:hypothetical protein
MLTVIPTDGIEEGVFFDLPESTYHNDPALGSTDIRRLLEGPSEFHHYWAGNPDVADYGESDALTFGKAVHKLVLEGTQAFDGAFAYKPDGPDVLVTQADMQRWLDAYGLHTKGSKDVLAERILATNPNVVIQDRVVERAKADGKAVLPAEAWKRILMASAYITQNPHLARSFEGGHREVSVFWVRRGIRLKARFDYLRVIQWDGRRTAVISDLKSFSRVKPGQPISQAVTEIAASYRHQAQHYLDGLKHARSHIRNKLVHGLHGDDDWLQRVAMAQDALFAFVMFKSQGAPFADARLLSPQNPILEIARRDIELALDAFRAYYQHFGATGPWVTLDTPSELSIDEIPRWML